MLTMYKMHHPRADKDRLYVKRKEGGRGLVQVEAAYKTEISKIAEYLNTKYKEDQFVNIVKNHESTQPIIIIIIIILTSYSPFPPSTSPLEPTVTPPLRLQVSGYSTFRITCDVPSKAAFCRESIISFSGMASTFFLNLLFIFRWLQLLLI
jgi:hypothetical protein